MKAILLPTEASAVGQYRILTVAKYLRRLGWDVPEVAPTALELGDLEDLCRGADIIVSQRNQVTRTTAALRAAADLNRCPLVMDADDNFLTMSRDNPAFTLMLPGSEPMTAAMLGVHAADAITTSTPGLAVALEGLNPNAYVCPNAQDMDNWETVIRAKRAKDKVIIGWAGAAAHYYDLKLVWNGVKRALYENKNAEFHVFGYAPDFLRGQQRVVLHPEFVEWSQYHQALENKGFDIGIAPIRDTAFNESKSNIKWQEYAMLKVPTVASKRYSYLAIEDGVTGFLADDSAAAWTSKLNQLIRNPELRKKLGSAAHKEIKKHYDMATNVKVWADAYERIIATHQPE